MEFTSKKIGVWGLGVVGKAAVRFFHKQGISVNVMENREISAHEQNFLTDHRATLYRQNDVTAFLASHDFCIASPGIDLRPYQQYQKQFITELDIFASFWQKPIIAITGSIGKTTVTHLLSQLLSKKMRVATGGNIGIGMLDLLAEQDNADCALLEVSSFQLEQCTAFAPTVALWTNFHPNHLDRHGTSEEYFKAKAQLLLRQKETDHALVPLELLPMIRALIPKRPLLFFSITPPAGHEALLSEDGLYYIENNEIVFKSNLVHRVICSLDLPPRVSFLANWLIIIAALDALKLFTPSLLEQNKPLTMPEHRLEPVTTINGAAFYNDSKSTLPAATLAALNNFAGKPVILFVGGISKGVDRAPFIKELAGKVKMIYFFGKEADMLHHVAIENDIKSAMFETLEAAVQECMEKVQAGDIVLFSPAGASYDLFKNYEERGARFKELMMQEEQNQAEALT